MLNVKPTQTDGNGCNWGSDTKNWLVECVITEHLVWCVCVCMCIWCMFICVCLSVCARDALFLYCVWCSTDTEQQGWRESLLTVSDGKLWNGNKASCHYSTNSLSCTHGYTGKHSKTAMITDKLANNISQLSLVGRLNSNCYERHALVNRESFWMLTNTAATKTEGFGGAMGKSSSLKFGFVLCFGEMNPAIWLHGVQYTASCVQGETTKHY